jgi:phage I-like protein
MKKTYYTRSGLIAEQIAIVACTTEISKDVPAEIKLFPAGEFRARDGRPEGLKAWYIDAEAAAKVVALTDAATGDFVIDYEHQTLYSEKNGQPAPAAGWFKKLEWREGDGLYAVDVRWTDKASAAIKAGEYRYISPVFPYDRKTGVVLGVLMAALTNYPALDGNSDLAVRAAAKFQTTKEDTVDRAALIASLGLAADASDEQIQAAIEVLKAKADSIEAKNSYIAELKTSLAASSGKPDPAKFVPITAFEALKGEVAALKSEQTSSAVETMVKEGIDEGKLLPVQEDWAKELGNKDLAALKSYLENTPAIAALKGSQTNGKKPKDDGQGDEGLSAEERAVCKNLNISPEDYRKANPV